MSFLYGDEYNLTAPFRTKVRTQRTGTTTVGTGRWRKIFLTAVACAHLVETIKADIAAGKFRPVQELCAERDRKNK